MSQGILTRIVGRSYLKGWNAFCLLVQIKSGDNQLPNISLLFCRFQINKPWNKVFYVSHFVIVWGQSNSDFRHFHFMISFHVGDKYPPVSRFFSPRFFS